VNSKRARAKHVRNFPQRTGNERCAIAVKAGALFSSPAGWRGCSGEVEAAHVVHARGHGGCNSSADEVVYLCTGHHREQEGRSRAFEARYGIDLRQLAAEQAGLDTAGPTGHAGPA
jgi:hypothetical protein